MDVSVTYGRFGIEKSYLFCSVMLLHTYFCFVANSVLLECAVLCISLITNWFSRDWPVVRGIPRWLPA